MKGLVVRVSGVDVAALAVYPDGALADVTLMGGRVLEDLYGLIGCRSVDVVRLGESLDMWVDDEGMLVGAASRPATRLAREYGFVWQPYYGVAVLTGGADRDGNTLSLAAAQAAAVRDLLTMPAPGVRPGVVCPECGHWHAGPVWGSICVGCPCPV